MRRAARSCVGLLRQAAAAGQVQPQQAEVACTLLQGPASSNDWHTSPAFPHAHHVRHASSWLSLGRLFGRGGSGAGADPSVAGSNASPAPDGGLIAQTLQAPVAPESVWPLQEGDPEAFFAIVQAVSAGDMAVLASARADAFFLLAWVMQAVQYLHDAQGLPWWVWRCRTDSLPEASAACCTHVSALKSHAQSQVGCNCGAQHPDKDRHCPSGNHVAQGRRAECGES
jgi:hypothetical protein